MKEPSIKGTAIKTLVQDAREGIESGRIPMAAANKTLLPSDFELLKEDVLDTGWYSLRAYQRIASLLRAQLGKGDPKYMHKRGAAVVERLIKLGVYQQVTFLEHIGVAESFAIGYQNLKLTASLWNSFFNFGTWTTSADEATRSFTMEVTESAPIPTEGWDAIEGFITRLAQEADREGVDVVRAHVDRATVRFRFKMKRASVPPPAKAMK